MATRFFSGSKGEILPEIEKFRELQAFCSHDLRSQIGAVAGLLSLLEEQIAGLDDKTKTSFQAAVTSAQEALENLDAHIADAKPNFDCIWLAGFSETDLATMKLDEALTARKLSRPKSILILNFTTPEEWQPRVKKYRPLAVFFKNRAALGADAGAWINRLGPQLTKIYLLDGEAGELAGARPGTTTLLTGSADLPALSQQLLEAIEALPHGRK